MGTSETILGYNLYAYCENNPVANIDETVFFINILKSPIKRFKNTCAGLASAVGKTNIVVRFISIDDKYWADVTVSGTYVFDKKEGFSIGVVLNNMGLYFQKQDLLVPYKWDVNYALLVE